MSVTIDTLLGWKPDKLDAVVTALVADKKALGDLEDDMTGARPTTNWVGEDADAARSSHDKLYDRAVDLKAQTEAVRNGVDSAQSDLTTAKSDLQAALTRAKNHDITVDHHSGELTWDSSAEDADTLRTTANEISRDITDALSLAATADGDLASVLSTAVVGGYDADGTLTDPGKTTGTMSDKELTDWLLDHPGRGKGLIDDMPEDVQQRVGRELSDQAKELANDDDLTEKEIDDLNTSLDAYGTNSTVSTSMLNKTGPKGMIDITANLAEQFRGDVPAGMRRELDDLQTNLGGVLDSGTEGLTKAGQEGDANNVSDEWLQNFMAQGRKEHPLEWEYTAGPPGREHERTNEQDAYGYQLLAPYLRGVDNSYFMNTVGTDMLNMETNRDFSDEHLTFDADAPGSQDVFEKIRASMWAPEQGDKDVRFDFTQEQSDGSLGPAGHDPMDAFLDGLRQNPAATREFLTGPNVDVPFVDGSRTEESPSMSPYEREVPTLTNRSISRLDYLLSDRSMNDATAGSLTEAINAATNDDPQSAEGQQDIKTILDETVRSLGEDEQMGNQRDGDLRTLSEEEKEELPHHEDVNRIHPGLRDGLAEILGNNYDSVSETFDQGTEVEPTGKHGLEWDRSHLDKVLTEVGRDESAAASIKETGANYEINELAESDHPTDDATSAGAGRLRSLYEAVGRGEDLGVEKEIDTEIEEHNGKVALVNKGQSYLTTGMALLAPSGAGTPASIAAATVSNEILAPAIESYERDGETRIELTLEDRELFRDKVATQILLDAQENIENGKDPLNP